MDSKEVLLKGQLARIVGNLTSLTEIIETAIGLTKNYYRVYKEASYEHKTLLAQAFFERITIKDKKIISANLNHPFAYICKDKASKDERFKLQYSGGGVES